MTMILFFANCFESFSQRKDWGFNEFFVVSPHNWIAWRRDCFCIVLDILVGGGEERGAGEHVRFPFRSAVIFACLAN